MNSSLVGDGGSERRRKNWSRVFTSTAAPPSGSDREDLLEFVVFAEEALALGEEVTEAVDTPPAVAVGEAVSKSSVRTVAIISSAVGRAHITHGCFVGPGP